MGNALAFSASMAGGAALLATSAQAFTTIKWAGAAYLVWLGIRAIRRAGAAGGATAARPPASPRAAFATTLAVGTFQPDDRLLPGLRHPVRRAGPRLCDAGRDHGGDLHRGRGGHRHRLRAACRANLAAARDAAAAAMAGAGGRRRADRRRGRDRGGAALTFPAGRRMRRHAAAFRQMPRVG
ncbi:LysE family transporter [Sphingomonas sp. MMS24-JH45]